MYCSHCGEKQVRKANFCSNCGTELIISISDNHSNSENRNIKLVKTRKKYMYLFSITYFFVFMVFFYRGYDPYYYVNFFPYGFLQILMIISAISTSIFTYKICGLLRKPTYLIIIYTMISPFILINFVPFIGLLADAKKDYLV